MTSKALNETRDRSQVQSVARAVALLDALTELGGTSSAAELAEASGLDRTVVHRLLRTLSEFDLVQKDGARYSLGSAALRYAGAYLDSGRFRRVALPYAMELQGRLGSGRPWSVSLGVPAGADVIVIERIWTPKMPLDAVLDIGLHLPGDGSAMGRAILAGLPEDRVRTLLGDRFTAPLGKRLGEVRARNLVEFSSSELQPGISAAAVGVRARGGGEPVGAVAVFGPDIENELTPDGRVPAALVRAATRIEAAL